MFRKTIFFMVLLMGTFSLIKGQMSTKMDARALLYELGSMLTEIPETKEECQELLKKIKAWQIKKLRGIEVQNAMLRITAPSNNAHVPERPLIEGIAAGLNGEVWVIVHPMEVSDYWVQPSVTLREDGTWKVYIHIGRSGNIDRGKHFEIRAVINPTINLSEGAVLRGWPEAQDKSPIIELIREY